MPVYFIELEIVEEILSDPKWRNKAKKVKNVEDLRRLLLDFCETRGRMMKIDERAVLLSSLG